MSSTFNPLDSTSIFDPLNPMGRGTRRSSSGAGFDPTNPKIDYFDPLSYSRHRPELPPSPVERGEGGFTMMSPAKEFGKGLYNALTSGNFEMFGEYLEMQSILAGKESDGSVGRRITDWAKSGREDSEPPVSWEEAEGFLGTLAYAGGLMGSGIGSTIPPLIAGIGGAIAGAKVGGVSGAMVAGPAGAAAGATAGGMVGGAAGAFTVGNVLNTGEAYRQFKDEGIPEDRAAKWAATVGPLISAIDTVGLGKVVDAAGAKKIKGQAIGNIAKQFAKGYAEGATTEGATEMVQSSIREATAAYLTGNVDLQRRAGSLLEEGFAGALTGGGIAGAGRGGSALLQERSEGRQTAAEKAGDEAERAATENPTGTPLDPYIPKGERIIAEANADADTNAILTERGVPGVGQKVSYQGPDGTALTGTIKGFMEADTVDGVQVPEAVVLEANDGMEVELNLPLKEGETLTVAPTNEEVAVVADESRFEESVAKEIESLPSEDLFDELQREGVSNVSELPQERRQPFLKAIKEKAKVVENQAKEAEKQAKVAEKQEQDAVKQAEKEKEDATKEAEKKETEAQQDKDNQLIFEQQRSELVEANETVGELAIQGIEEDVRKKLNIEGDGPVPTARHKTYMTLLKGSLTKKTKADQEKAKAKPKQATTEELQARKSEVVSPSGEKHAVQYEVVEGDDLIASNKLAGSIVGDLDARYAQELQNRGDLSEANENRKIQEYSDDLQVERVTESSIPENGAPIVGADNMVEVGNGRTLSIMLAYSKGKAGHYRQALLDRGYDTSGMKFPVLIRRRSDKMSSEERVKFAVQGNEPTSARLSTADQAMTDAGKINSKVLASYKGGSLSEMGNRDFLREFINTVVPLAERKEFQTDKGDLDSSGIDRMEAALMGYAYESKDVVTRLKATNEPVRKSVRNVMAESAPAWAKMKARIRTIDKSQDITENLVDVVNLIHRSVETNTPPLDLFSQQSLIAGTDPTTEGERGKINREVMKWFYQKDPFVAMKKPGEKKKDGAQLPQMAGQARIQERINSWIGRVDRYDPKQNTMFAGDTAKPLEALLSGVTTKDTGASQPDLLSAPAPTFGGKKQRTMQARKTTQARIGINTPAFEKWFGGSKVVDKSGKPMVMHHSGYFDPAEDPVPRTGKFGMHFGTERAAEERQDGKRLENEMSSVTAELTEDEDGNSGWAWDSDSIHMDDDIDLYETKEMAINAGKYEVQEDHSNRIDDSEDSEFTTTAVYLSIQNPLRLVDLGEWNVDSLRGQLGPFKSVKIPEGGYPEIVKAIQEAGYDGIVYNNQYEDRGKDSYIIFKANQAKSATHGKGTFRTDSDSILARQGERTDAQIEVRDKIARELLEIAGTIAPKAKVELYDKHEFEGGATGYYNPAEGLIEVAARSVDAITTMHHEGIHAIEDLLYQLEWDSLKQFAREQNWVKKHRIKENYKHKDREDDYREAVAFAYEDFVAGRDTFTNAPSFVRKIMIRIRRFLRNFGRSITDRPALMKDLKDIYSKVHSGEVGRREDGDFIQERQSSARLARNATTGIDDMSMSEETREELKESMQGRTQTPLKDSIKKWSSEMYQSFMRVHKDLPSTPANARVLELLRKLASAPSIASEKTQVRLDKMMRGLNKKQRELMTLKVFMDGFSEEVRAGRDVPTFKDAKEFTAAYKDLNDIMRTPSNLELMRRVRGRMAYNNEITKELVRLKVIPADALERKHYITHIVRQYDEDGRQFGTGERLKTPKSIKRKGTTLSINMNLMEAEAQWMARALLDIETAKTIEKVDKIYKPSRDALIALSRHRNDAARDRNVVDEIKKAFEGELPPGMNDAMTFREIADYVYKDAEPGVKGKIQYLPFFGALDHFRKTIGRQMGEISKLLGDTTMKIPKHFQGAADALRGETLDEGSSAEDKTWEFLGWLASEDAAVDSQFTIPARSLFAAITTRKQVVKNKLGEEWINTRNLKSALKKLTKLGDDTFAGNSAWQPDEGNLMYVATTITEKAVRRVNERISDIVKEADPEIADVIDLDILQDVANSMKEEMVQGGPKYQMVLPDGVALTLNSFKDKQLESQIDGALTKFTQVWKVNTLINPQRVIKYNIRNVSGDLDHVIAAMGMRGLNVKKIGSSIGELWQVMFRGAEPSQRYRRALDGAVMEGGFVLNEAQDKQVALDRYVAHIDRGTAWVKRAWRLLARANTMRENILRYSTFNIVTDHIDNERTKYATENQQRELKPTPENVDKVFKEFGGYGATKRDHIRNLDNWEDIAANYARETLGDYGNISVQGRELRRKWIPFWSWKEINAKFYKRLASNINFDYRHGDKTAPQAANTISRALAGIGIRKAAYLYSRSMMFSVASILWNNLSSKEDEESLSDTDRRKFHLILGNRDGEIKMLPTPGALTDLLSWVGYEDVFAALNHIQQGRGSWTQILRAVSSGFVNTLGQGLTPVLKLPIEMLTEKEYFPDVLNARPMKDRWHHIQRAMSVDKYVELYGALTNSGRPTQGPFHILEGLVLDQRHTGYSSYTKIRSHAFDYKSIIEGKDASPGVMSDRQVAYYNYKLSLRFKDVWYGGPKQLERAKARLKELKVTRRQRADMLDRAKPLGMFTSRSQMKEFKRTLSPSEERALVRAEQYWRDVFKSGR